MRVPIHRVSTQKSESGLEFFVQELSPKPMILEALGRINGGKNQFYISIHQGRSLLQEMIVTGPESVARIYVEQFSSAKLLASIDPSAYKKIWGYIQSCQAEP